MTTKAKDEKGLALNTDKAIGIINQIKNKVGDLAIRMAHNKVKTEEEYELAITLGKESAEAIKDVKTAADSQLKDAKAYVKKVGDVAKAIISSIEDPQTGLRERCREYLRKEQEKKDKEIARLAKQKQDAETKALNADTEAEQQTSLAKVDKLEEKIETKVADVPQNQARERKFRITDEKLVPREYLVIDEKALRAAGGGINQPLRTDIPGVEYYDDLKVVFK